MKTFLSCPGGVAAFIVESADFSRELIFEARHLASCQHSVTLCFDRGVAKASLHPVRLPVRAVFWVVLERGLAQLLNNVSFSKYILPLSKVTPGYLLLTFSGLKFRFQGERGFKWL